MSGSSTLPRTTTRAIEAEGAAGPTGRTDKVAAATSSTSLYDNVATSQPAHQAPPKRKFKVEIINPRSSVDWRLPSKLYLKSNSIVSAAVRQSETQQAPTRPPKSQETSTMTTNTSTAPKTVTASVGTHGTSVSNLHYLFDIIYTSSDATIAIMSAVTGCGSLHRDNIVFFKLIYSHSICEHTPNKYT